MPILKFNSLNCISCKYMSIKFDDALTISEMKGKYSDMDLYAHGTAYKCSNPSTTDDKDELQFGILSSFTGKKIRCFLYYSI